MSIDENATVQVLKVSIFIIFPKRLQSLANVVVCHFRSRA